MNVLVTGYTDGKKIVAIKGIRAATGLGLKESKDVADHLDAGRPQKISLRGIDSEHDLQEHGVVFKRVPVDVPLEDLIDILAYYPPELTVGDVIGVLRAANAHSPAFRDFQDTNGDPS